MFLILGLKPAKRQMSAAKATSREAAQGRSPGAQAVGLKRGILEPEWAEETQPALRWEMSSSLQTMHSLSSERFGE